MDDRPIKVLLIEDNPGDERLLREMLKEGRSANIDVTCAASLDEALHITGFLTFDLYLLDLNLPDSTGLATYTRLQDAVEDVPVVVLSGMDDETVAVRAVQAGAQDYLMKGEADGNLLIRSIRYAIERHRMRMALRSLSLIDELTGLYNRRGFLTLAVQQLKTAERLNQRMMLLFADLDDLKIVNDNLGHSQGDLALKGAASILRGTFRESDIVARLGGDEFVVLIMAVGDESADAIKDRLSGNVNAYNAREGCSWRIALSTGIVHYDPESPCDVDELLEQADRLMYQQKKSKKGS